MANPNNCDLTQDRLFYMQTGIIFKTVCAPKSWSCERVADEATRADPPGTSANRWVVANPRECEGGDFNNTNNLQCPDDCNRTHWLLNC